MAALADSHRILVVDDDVSFTGVICAALERLAVRADVAVTGSEAMRKLGCGAYAGLLLDLQLPDTPGLSVLRKIRQRGDPVRVVVLTGAASVTSAVEAMKLGAVDFLEKPVRPAQLSEIVRTLLSAESLVARQPGGATKRPPGPEPLVDQLARAMVAVVIHPEDVPTVLAWCALIGRSKSSVSALCELIGVAPKAALDLARVLRAMRTSATSDVRETFLVADPRTVTRLLERAGSLAIASAQGPVNFLDRQQFIGDRRVIDRLAHYLGTTS
jgi:ActR/RegA family two-component response regulator